MSIPMVSPGSSNDMDTPTATEDKPWLNDPTATEKPWLADPATAPEDKPWLKDPQAQSVPRAAANSFAQAAVKGIGSVLKGIGAFVEDEPPGTPGVAGVSVWTPENQSAMDQYMARVRTETPSQHYQRLTDNPLYQQGAAIEDAAKDTYPTDPGEDRFIPKMAGMTGGFLPLVAASAAAPAVIGLQSYGEHLGDDFAANRALGMSEDDAAKKTLDTAAASGFLQAGVFAALPAPLRKLSEKYIADAIGGTGVKRFLAGRAATAAEGAALGASSQGAENVVEGQPLTQGTDSGAASMAAINLLLPYGNTAKESRPVDMALPHTPRPVDDALPMPLPGGVMPLDKLQARVANAPQVLPESDATLAAQVAATKNPESPKAVTLVTPPNTVPDDHGLTEVPTAQGTALVNTAKTDAGKAQAAINNGGGGQLMGLSTDNAPEDADMIVQTSTRGGTVLQDELVTPDTVDAAVDQAKKLAPKATVTLKPAGEVLADRNAATPTESGIAIQGTTDLNPVSVVPAQSIATRPDLMQFKRMDDESTGVNKGDELRGRWDPLKAGNLLLWEPKDAAAYGLEPEQQYIVANGHHRFEFGERQDVPAYNAQVIREADGYSAQDARALAAEINIADGKGTVYDATKFLRNESATHGTDEALARAGRIGIKGGQASDIAFQAGADTYDAFVNERIRPDQAQAISTAARQPGDPVGIPVPGSPTDSLQRLGLRKALDGASPLEIRNIIQAVRLEGQRVPMQQFDLFASDDSAIKTAEQLASIASRIQGELGREIRATESAAKNAVTAKAKGLKFERTPGEMLAENAKLKAERDRWDNWALHPDLIAQVRGYAEMKGEASKPKVSTLDDKLAALKLDTSGQLHAFGLVPAAWNAVVDAVRLAVKGGMKVADAVNSVISKFKQANPNVPFDEAGARAHLNATTPEEGQAERGFTEKLRQAQDVADGIKEGVTNTIYERRTNETDAQLATRLINEQGMDKAILSFADKNNDLPGSVRGILGQQIIRKLSATGDINGAIAFHDNYFADHITDVAQTLQAQRAWLALTPEGQTIWAKKQMDNAARDRLKPVTPDIEAAKRELLRQNENGIRNTTAAPDVQDEAKRAVDESIKDNAAVHQAVVMELSGPWAQSPTILNAARDQVRDKANDLLTKQPKPIQFTASQHLTAIMDDLAQRAANIAANYFQGVAQHAKGLSGLLAERLGLDDKRALSLAKALEEKWKQQLEAAKAKLPAQIRAVRAGQALHPESPTPIVDAAIRRELKNQQSNLGKVVYTHFTDQAQTGKDLTERLVKEAGLSPEASDRLAKTLQKRFVALTAKAKQAALDRLLKPVQAFAKTGLIDRLLKLSNVGAFDDKTYWNAVKEKLNLPTWSQDLQVTLKGLADKIANIPEDRQADWQKAQTDFMNELNRAKGFSWFDANHAFFITNLLSGLTTHAKVAIHTSLNMAGAFTTEFGRAIAEGRPEDIPLLFEAAAKGSRNTLADAADIMRTGVSTGTKIDSIHGSRFHELAKYGTAGGVPIDTTRGNVVGRTYATALKALLESAPAKILNLWKYNDRLVTAQHVLYYKPAEEMKAALLTSRIAREEGMSPKDAANEARRILGYGAQANAEAKVQATREGLTGLAATRRAGEILQMRRPVEVKETAKQYALRQTFLNEPYGLVGQLANKIGDIKAGDDTLNRAAKVAAPFTRIAANILNEGLNYSPIGALRAATAKNTLLGFDLADMNPVAQKDLRAELYAKAALGTALLGGIALSAARTLSSPNPAFTLYGAGPSSPEDQERWRATGAIPWSIKAGNRYVSYANTPANATLAAYGSYLDKLRDSQLYKRADAERAATSAVNSVAVALQGTAGVVLQQPYLQQLTEMLALTTEKNPELASRGLEKTAVRIGSSFVVPNLLRQIDRFGDPSVYDQKRLDGILTSATPYVRREGRPILNVFGEPLQQPVSAMFASKAADDPIVSTLNKYNAWPAMPSRNATMVQGVPLNDDEFYAFTQARGQALRKLMGAPTFDANLAKVRANADKAINDLQSSPNPTRAAIIAAKVDKAPQLLINEYDKEASKAGALAVLRMRGGAN